MTKYLKFSQFSFINQNELVVLHVSGFFSTCSVILSELVIYFNLFGSLYSNFPIKAPILWALLMDNMLTVLAK